MASQSVNGMETYTIAGIRYEIPSAVAEMLNSSKSHLQVTIFNPKSERFLEYCAGVGSIGEREIIDVSGLACGRDSAAVLEEVKSGGCVCVSGFVEGEEEEVEVVEVVPESKEEVGDSKNTDYWFGYSEEKGEDAIAEESSVGAEITAGKRILDELVAMANIAKFNISEGTDDCEIVQPSGAVSKKKKKVLPMRIQPTRETSKRKQIIVKEEAVAAKPVKRPRRSKSGKEILQEVACSKEFLENEGLTEVLDLLKAQGWENLCADQDFVCPEVVEDFYQDLKLSDDPVPTLEVKFRGNEFLLSSTELAELLGLEHEGFDYFCKSSVWPKGMGDKQKLVKKICKLNNVPKGTGISTQCMEPNVKILHKFLVSNFLQRGVKPSYVQHQDLLLLEKLLNREKINLPKLMIHQIDHLKDLTQIGYSRVIKRVLQKHNLYEVSSGSEVQIVKDFDPDVFRKMHLVKDKVEGWVKAPVQEPKPKGKPVLQEVEEEADSEDETEDDNSKLMKVFEEVISDVKTELRGIRTEMREFKKEVREAIDEMRDELTTLVDKL